ncbi:TPA: hypothetical protein R7S29_003260, partial [Acinetobacter baumannii]|nr:hypothetical protein [Acinetobacter baumannii]
MIDIQDYFKDSKDLSDSELIKADITAEELIKIYYDYMTSLKELEAEGIYLSNRLQFCDDINSVRWRTKDPVHLLTKIVRKRKEAIEKNDSTSKYLSINENNYKKIITDLIGLRAIYLFKFQWKLVDNFICNNFKINHDEKIVIYHAPEDDLKFYYEDGYEKEVSGARLEYSRQKKSSKYRSTHYIIEANFPHDFKLEIQIRSILDEAWGEIDHSIRYPDHQNDEDLQRKMTILNGAINGCEELATNYIEDFQNKTLEVVKDIFLEEEVVAEHVDSEEVVAEHVDSEEVAAGHVNQEEVAAGHVDQKEVVAGRVDQEEVAAGRVDQEEVAAGHVDQEEMLAGRVDSEEVAAGHVDQEEVDVSKQILESLALQSDVSRIATTAFPSDISKKGASSIFKNMPSSVVEKIRKQQEDEERKAKAFENMTRGNSTSSILKNMPSSVVEKIRKQQEEEERKAKAFENMTRGNSTSSILKNMPSSVVEKIRKQQEDEERKAKAFENMTRGN